MKTLLKYIVAVSIVSSFNTYAIAQSEQQSVDIGSKKISTVPFYKWEIGIDALPLIDKSKDPFGYVLKRNFQKDNGRQALRLKLLPRIGFSGVGGTVSNSSIYLAVGYEWQKLYGRFATLYGLEPFIRYDHNIIDGQIASANSDTKRLNTGLNGFLGGRYYIGSHFAITLESHLIYNYQKVDINDSGLVGFIRVRENIIYFNPLHTVYLSYHF